MNHRVGRVLFAAVVGLAVAVWAFQWATNPEPRAERAVEEKAVEVVRTTLTQIIGAGQLEIVDPLAPNRKVGKVYVYAEPPGWAVSGYYRRSSQDPWHPYLMTLDEALALEHLKVQDPSLVAQAASDPRLEASP